jgi:hypothetical protein
LPSNKKATKHRIRFLRLITFIPFLYILDFSSGGR